MRERERPEYAYSMREEKEEMSPKWKLIGSLSSSLRHATLELVGSFRGDLNSGFGLYESERTRTQERTVE